jgi:diaminopimelate decarboxylase
LRSAGPGFITPRSQSVGDRLAETVVLRRCAQYRKEFRCAAVSYPADVLRLDAPADWIKHRGVAIDVADADQLAEALSTSVVPQRIIMHLSDQGSSQVSRATEAGAGRYVVNSRQQAEALAGAGPARRRVLVDMTDQDADELVAAVISGVGLDMIGVHRRLSSGEDGRASVRTMIAEMRRIARRYPLIPARLSLGDVDAADWDCAPDDPAMIAAAIGDAVEDGCIVSHLPSPAVNVAPSTAALIH